MGLDWEDHKELKILKEKLIKRYNILECMGAGGFGKVFKLKDRRLGRECALKVLYVNSLLEHEIESVEEIKNRFVREASVYAKCNHNNIVQIYDIGSKDVSPHLIMEYIEGTTLKKIITEQGKLEFSDIVKISENILHAIGYIHSKGLVHRDIKPNNIMIEKKTGRPVLIDFGIAKDMMASSNLTMTGDIIGTPHYMSPEQFQGSSKINNKSDIYSFGVMLYEMLTGEPVFKGPIAEIMYGHLSSPVPDVRKKNLDLPAGIQKIIEKAMAKKPEDRFQSAAEFLEALKKIEEKDKIKKVLLSEKEKRKEAKNKRATKSTLKEIAPDAKKDVEDIPQKGRKEKQVKIKKQVMPEIKTNLFVPLLRSKRVFKFLIFLNVILAILVVLDTAPLHILDGESKKQIRPLKKAESQYDDIVTSAQMLIKKGEYEKARYYLNNAKTIRNSVVLKELSETIILNQREKMKKDFEVLKAFLEGTANIEKKRERCSEFLNKSLNVPKNDEIESMISYVEKYVTQHEKRI